MLILRSGIFIGLLIFCFSAIQTVLADTPADKRSAVSVLREGYEKKFDEAQALIREGKGADALHSIEQMNEYENKNRYEEALIAFLNGYFYFQKGQHELALKNFKTITDNPKGLAADFYINAYQWVGEILIKQKNYAEAQVYILKGIEEIKRIEEYGRAPMTQYLGNLLRTTYKKSRKYPQNAEYVPAMKVAPQYPSEAVRKCITGDVVVQFTVTKKGKTRDVVAVESTDDIFNMSAEYATSKFTYAPRVVNGKPVDVPNVKNKITYDFSEKCEKQPSLWDVIFEKS